MLHIHTSDCAHSSNVTNRTFSSVPELKSYLQTLNIQLKLPAPLATDDYLIIPFRRSESKICPHSFETGCGSCTAGPINKFSYYNHIHSQYKHPACYSNRNNLNWTYQCSKLFNN